MFLALHWISGLIISPEIAVVIRIPVVHGVIFGICISNRIIKKSVINTNIRGKRPVKNNAFTSIKDDITENLIGLPLLGVDTFVSVAIDVILGNYTSCSID